MALRHCDTALSEQVANYQQRRDILIELLQRMDWDVSHPQAGMFVWARRPEPCQAMESMEFTLRLMKATNVAVAPGIGFGEEGEGYWRLALVENEHRLRQAVRQMRRALPGMMAP